MPRSRGSEMPQRQSPRGGVHQLRTSSSESEPLHHRPIADRSPKLGDRRSPRGAPNSDPVNQKKLGIRIADLESQLGQAQEELKNLKDQLASAEAAKKEAQEKLEKKTKKPEVAVTEEIGQQHSITEVQELETQSNPKDEIDEENQAGTDVFEVSVEKTTVEPKVESSLRTYEYEKETNPINTSTEPLAVPEPEKASIHDLILAKNEINTLKNKLYEKEKELEVMGLENESLKKQLNEATLNISTAHKEKEEMTRSLNKIGEELQASKAEAIEVKEKLEATEGAKEALETEMKRLRVQTGQWKKAADAAAAILSGGMDMNGRIPERCGSMGKHLSGAFEPLAGGGYTGFVGSPGMADDLEDGFSSGKRKGSGIKMFGDLWKKKGHK